MTIYMWVATCAWLLLIAGYFSRANRVRHVPLMLTGIGLDFGLVLYLQFTRGAVQKALEFSLALLKQAHIGVSTLALILYIPVLITGFRIVRGDNSRALRERHAQIARVCLVLRTLGFAFMFSMLQ